MLRTTVLIAGGGVSGLTTAYDLNRLGVDCIVAERAQRLGGLIFTDERDGFLMDGGPDAFLAQKPQGTALCQELGLGSEMIPTNPDRQKVYVLYDGKLRALPIGMRLTVPTQWLPFLRSDLFTWRGKLRMLLERWTPKRANIDEESVESFVVRRFGRESFERLGEPMLAGIHCGDGARLSMDVLFPRLVSLEERTGSVTRGMIAAGRQGTAFTSLAGGMGRLIEALANKLPDDHVVLGEAVEGVHRDDEGFVATLTSGETVRSKVVLLALPIHATGALARSAFPTVADIVARIKTASSAVVFHAFEKSGVEHSLDGYGFVVPTRESNRLLAATFVTTKFPGRAPDDGVLIRTFLGGLKDPAALSLSDDALVELSRCELEKAVGPLATPKFSKVVRWPNRTPQVELGHRKIIQDLDNELARTPGLYVLGNGLKSVGIPDCIGQARKTAKDIAVFVESDSAKS
jgi:oxygen-dependent protoporphyrinogen oxidase